ncbi:hypothetical protein BDW67DRAFT_60747 [Aspergillus spinulosporus]
MGPSRDRSTMLHDPVIAVVFDLSDLFLPRPVLASANISRHILKDIFSSDIWHGYECGQLTEKEAYWMLSTRYSLDVADLAEILQARVQARARARVQGEIVRNEDHEHEHLINNLQPLKVKAKADGSGPMLCGMLNIPQPEYATLQDSISKWALFDHIFVSCQVGMRKPDLCFYRHVLHELGLFDSPERALFVETNPENVLPARSVGSRVILHTDTNATLRSLQNILCDPVARGKEFLRVNAKRLHSVTSTGVVIRDNFTQLLVLEATGDRELVYLEEHARSWNFFIESVGNPLLTTLAYPDDFDTTALALTILEPPDVSIVQSVLNEMASHVSADGIILTYFDTTRPRVDPVVCVNVLTLFHRYGRGHELHTTLSWVRDVLKHRAYMDGTRYYATPEAFLYFLARFLESASTEGAGLLAHDEFVCLLRERVVERVGLPGDALALAMRLLAARYVGIADVVDEERLREMQCEDGGWKVGWVYRYGKTDVRIGNRGLATALAIKALELPLLVLDSQWKQAKKLT